MIQLCTFFVGGHRFGLDAMRVREVIRHETTRPVPLAPAGVAGVTNVRGDVLAVIDLGLRLGLPAGERRLLLVFGARGALAGLLIDRAGDVVQLGEGARDDSAAWAPAAGTGLVKAAYSLDDGPLLELDPRALVAG